MKKISNRILMWGFMIGAIAVASMSIISCATSKKFSVKSGAELWATNCQHCHNTPSPSSFSGDQWETIGMHMQTRALITEYERDKIVGFLQQVQSLR